MCIGQSRAHCHLQAPCASCALDLRWGGGSSMSGGPIGAGVHTPYCHHGGAMKKHLRTSQAAHQSSKVNDAHVCEPQHPRGTHIGAQGSGRGVAGGVDSARGVADKTKLNQHVAIHKPDAQVHRTLVRTLAHCVFVRSTTSTTGRSSATM